MSGIAENTGTFMLSREVELLMAERAQAAARRRRGRAARRRDGHPHVPARVATEADILAESVNALPEGHPQGRARLHLDAPT
jgi:hypothetical protein